MLRLDRTENTMRTKTPPQPAELSDPRAKWTCTKRGEHFIVYEARVKNDVILCVSFHDGELFTCQSEVIFPRYLCREFKTVADMIEFWLD